MRSIYSFLIWFDSRASEGTYSLAAQMLKSKEKRCPIDWAFSWIHDPPRTIPLLPSKYTTENSISGISTIEWSWIMPQMHRKLLISFKKQYPISPAANTTLLDVKVVDRDWVYCKKSYPNAEPFEGHQAVSLHSSVSSHEIICSI